ncbi:hypothetical protein [uncultured Tenacibaculum sp.]|uniref:hypothetical protein n=1 Tax=uncultured Tenacibaculum sp. TaxID=174713 RepID=UPI00261E9EBF|nr:hypothetical protein [uncultured Tenacibaculum sp.]
MKNYITKISLSILICIMFSCSNKREKIIKDNDTLEFRKDFTMKDFHRKLILIEPNSSEFIAIQKLINNLTELEEVDEFKEASYYRIIGKNVRILINRNTIYILHKNAEGSIRKFRIGIADDEYDVLTDIDRFDWIYDFGNIYGQGKFEQASFTFCGVVPTNYNYEYKVGKWKFWNLNREFLGEGTFKVNKVAITENGGCDYEVYKSKMNHDWHFVNDKNKDNLNLIYNIENAKKLNFYDFQ